MVIFHSYVSLPEGTYTDDIWQKNGVRLNRSQRSQPPLAGRFAGLAVRSSLFVGFEAMNVFESLKQSGAEMNSVVYNTVLDVGN